MRKTALALGIVTAMLAPFPAMADDVTDALEQAVSAYKNNDLKTARQQADLAATLMAQKSAEGIKEALPGALSGWQADDANTQGASASMFGGGIQAARSYQNENGDSVNIEIIGDSPMMTQMALMLSNPAMAASMGKIVKVAGRQAIRKEDDELTMIVANRFLVTVSGSAGEQDKLAYAEAIDFARLEK